MSFRNWIELESDPGLFTLLVYDFGVKGVEVEEVYDLSKTIERDVYGFIFLFKWTEERKTRRKAVVMDKNFVVDKQIENDMFFAQQLIPNSCASHALLSVLLNVPNVSLGYTLKQLRDSCKGFDPETKGHAIGNFWNIAVAHNNHGRPELRWPADRSKNVTASRSMEAFHYVSYIPYNGRLFELDGLKPHPIDHGPWSDSETWSDKARKVIQDRIQIATGGELSHDIRYNLLAVVPDQRKMYKEKMDILNHNKKVLIEVFKKLACKQSFVVDTPTNSILKQSDFYHPFPDRKLLKRKRANKRNDGKSVSFQESPLSPESNSSSTLTGNDSLINILSDSDDSCPETYRIKSIMRGKSPIVYVYGGDDVVNLKTEDQSEGPSSTDQIEKGNSTVQENEIIDQTEKQTSEEQKRDENSTECQNQDNPEDEQKSAEQNEDIAKTEPSLSEDSINENVTNDANETVLTDTVPMVTEESSQNELLTDSKDETVKMEIDANDLTSQTSEKADETENVEVIKNENVDDESNTIESTPVNDNSKDNTIMETDLNNVPSDDGEGKCKEDDSLIQKYDTETTKTDTREDSKVREEKPGIGVEIVASDIDIHALLDQKTVNKLSLEEVLKYEERITLPDLQKCMQDLDEMHKYFQSSYKEELDKVERYKIDDCRRRHNYEPFVATFLSMLAEQGHLGKLLEDQNSSVNAVKKGVFKGKEFAGRNNPKKKFKRR